MEYAPLRQSTESTDHEYGNVDEASRATRAVQDSSDGRRRTPIPSVLGSGLGRSRSVTVCAFLVFLLLLAATWFGVGGLRLVGLSSTATNSDEPSQESEVEHPGDSNHYQHYDGIPDIPSWRKAEEYVLSPGWDFNAPPTTREYNWTITDVVFNPDGVYRPMILINNQFPGPLVEANDGDMLVVHIANRGVNATAIHFHGMYQNGTNAMDGTVGVTQCPIAPATDYTYRFQVKGQSGTYWYHAHQSAQASDGLVGPFVVHARDERTELQRLAYASDRVIMVQDHYHNTTAELLMDYLRPEKENAEPVPGSGLINGRGVRSCASFPSWPCDNSTVQFPELRLGKNQQHRLRIINVGAFAEFQLQVDEHPFYVTEVDGTDVEPEPFHRLNILPAQRYSIVVETNVTSNGSTGPSAAYWLRAKMVTRCFADKNPYLEAETRAIIRYVDPEELQDNVEQLTAYEQVVPTSEDWGDAVEVICRDLNTSALRPVVVQEPPPADEFVWLRASFRIGAWRLSRGFFNSSSWKANVTSPSLHRFLDAPENHTSTMSPEFFGQASLDLFDPSHEFVLQTNGIRTVDIALNNFDDGAHPFHLHGHKFFVLTPSLRGDPPRTAEDLKKYYLENGNEAMLKNPLRRDTVTVSGFEWVIIRVVLDNPGIWALHCHNAWHAEAGMSMQLLVRGDEIKKQNKNQDYSGVGDEERDLCRRSGVAKGVRPDDSIWFGQF